MLWRFKFRYLFMGFFGVFMVMTHPAIAATPSTDFVITHKNEFTFILCLLVWGLASWLGMKLPSENEDIDLEPSVKLVTALLGGLLAFAYCLYRDKSLTLLNPVWIAAASIVLPVTILNLRVKLKEYTKAMDFSKNGD